MRIAVDAMGGDHAPGQIVRGAVAGLAYLDAKDEVILIGDPTAIEKELAEVDGRCERIRIQPASQVIGMDEEPVEALRTKKDSSISRMIEMAALRKADAVISAGNTGACAAAAQPRPQAHSRRQPGGHRDRAAESCRSMRDVRCWRQCYR